MKSHSIGCSETAKKWAVAVQIVVSIFVRGSSSMRSANSYFRLEHPLDDLLQNSVELDEARVLDMTMSIATSSQPTRSAKRI
jgi:hypothetical protein